VGQGTAPDPALAVANFEKACKGDSAASCAEVAMLYNRGVGGVQDHQLALRRLRKACDLGLIAACPPGERAHAPKAEVLP
jgi:TPR repeat protein